MILDCTDNVDIRNALDRSCEKAKIPPISGAAIRLEGQVSVFTYEPNTPTYRQLSQLLGKNVLSCVEAGVLAPIVGVVGSIQALEAIKVRLKIGSNLCGRLLLIDGLTMRVRRNKITCSNSWTDHKSVLLSNYPQIIILPLVHWPKTNAIILFDNSFVLYRKFCV